MTPTRHINAEHLLLVLVARRATSGCRWAAMADHTWSPNECRARAYRSATVLHHGPTLAPMQRGHLHRAIQRQRLTQGLPSIRRTFGAGLRALLAEPAHVVPAGRQACHQVHQRSQSMEVTR